MTFLSIFLLAALPALIFCIPLMTEPYALLDPQTLNQFENQSGRTPSWCNMGWWENTKSFSAAAEALSKKLLGLAKEGGYQGGGRVLVLHLSQVTPPNHLHGLTSLASDTAKAKALVGNFYPNSSTHLDFFTFSAQFRPGKDIGHPLDPNGGYLKEHIHQQASDRMLYDDKHTGRCIYNADPEHIKKSPYNLVYILDSIYHYPPSLMMFLDSLRPILSPSGLVVYTDLLPPQNISSLVARVLSYLFAVPLPNLIERPASIEEYRATLEKHGWKNVVVEDWSDNIWAGFSTHLKQSGGAWPLVGSVVRRAEKDGWRFIGVRVEH
nr:hypothetical protein L204_02611 [Cryptococcus depauperatus CBS 7855]